MNQKGVQSIVSPKRGKPRNGERKLGEGSPFPSDIIMPQRSRPFFLERREDTLQGRKEKKSAGFSDQLRP